MGLLNDKMFDYKLRAGDNLPVPVMTTPVVHGTPGSTSYSYRASFVTLVGETTPTEAVVVTTGPATINNTNYIALSVESVPAAATFVRFYKLQGGVYYLLQEVAASIAAYNDKGVALQTAELIKEDNTSGRPQWRALLFNHGVYLQRQELIDLQWIMLRGVKDLAEASLHRDGDIISGCAYQFDSGTTWNFTTGKVYIQGQIVDVPAGQVELVGTGVETVGIVVTPTVVSHVIDPVMRNQDELVDLEYAQDGAARLIYEFVWGIDQDNQLDIQKFTDNTPLIVTVTPETTVLDRKLANRTRDVSGNFVVRNFPVEVQAHATDATQLTLKIGPGLAYVEGYPVETIGYRFEHINKAREYGSRNNSTIDAYESDGGAATATNAENYNVNGLKVKLKVGSGNAHTVTLSGVSATAATVATQIEAALNGYISNESPDLITCIDATGSLNIRARDDQTLEIMAIAGDAYTILGLSEGVILPTGQRIYDANDAFLKTITDLNYSCEHVVSVSYNGTTDKNLLLDNQSNSGVYDVLGASLVLADCHDGLFTYEKNVDFERDGDYISFVGMSGEKPGSGVPLYVKYRYQRNAVKGTRVLTTVANEEVTKLAYQGQDDLGHSDVVEITKISNTIGGDNAWDEYVFLKNSTAMLHATSQIDWSTAGAQGVGQPTTNAKYYVSYTYWAHSAEGDYVSADSYDTYASIELAPDGVTYLRDCIDFRTTSTSRPINADNPVFDYDFYFARVDKLAVSPDGTLSVIEGNAAIEPPIPTDQEGKLTVAQIIVSPYTYYVSDVKVRNVGVMRTTQLGISDMKDRIARLEYWQTVNDLENQTTYSDAAIGAKGLFTDPITGQNKMSWSFSKTGNTAGVEGAVIHTAAIDAKNREVKIPVTQVQQLITLDESESENISLVGNQIVLGYQPVLHQESKAASRRQNLNPDLIWSPMNGRLTLTPGVDMFYDTEQLPRATINYDNNMAALLNILDAERIGQIDWGAWNRTGGGRFDFQTWWGGGRWNYIDYARTGTQIDSIVPDRQVIDFGDRVVDLSTIQFMRTKNTDNSPFEIAVVADSLMVNADHRCEIAGVNVNLTATGDSVAGTSVTKNIVTMVYSTNPVNGEVSVTSRVVPTSLTTVKTDSAGRLTAKFTMPAGVECGTCLVRILHATTDDVSEASANFYGSGLKETKQATTLGMTSARVNTTCVSGTRSDWWITDAWGWDPLAQSFLVMEDNTYLCAVGVFFAAKSATKPVTCEIRKMVNGMPSKDVFQSVTKQAADITISDDATSETVFTFPDVVGYNMEEYAIVLMTNCVDYEVWNSELGDTDIITGNVIMTQSHGGVQFHSPNNSTWQPETKKDLKFKLYKSNFVSDCAIVFENLTGIEASYLVLKTMEFLAPGTNAKWSYSLDNGTSWVAYRPWVDTYLGSIATQVRLKIDVTSLGGAYAVVKEFNGIVFLLHEDEATYIGNSITFTDAENYPNEVRAILDLDTDGVNGAGSRSVTPYYTVDDGLFWCELKVQTGYNAVAKDDPFMEWEFSTRPDAATVTGATNASPIVITSAGHGFNDNEIVVVATVGGNTAANDTWRVANATANTFELVDPDTGVDSQGNSAYTSGGTAVLAEFTQCRLRVDMTTASKAVTPRVRNIRLLCNERI
jgi:hypothetical protein